MAQWFDKLAQLKPEEHDTFFERCRQEDPETARQLILLWKQDQARETPLDKPAFAQPLAAQFREETVDGPTEVRARLNQLPEAIPRQIGEYQILALIGSGGMGTVYLARQSQPERDVALKVLNMQLPGQREKERFIAEANILAKLNHPNISTIHQVALDAQGHPFLVMEHVQGKRLTDYCNAKKLDIRTRIELFLEVCDALILAHQRGVIHRDLKPDHVLVHEGKKPVVKIIDFGIAQAEEVKLQTVDNGDGPLGTPYYAAPEQLQPGEPVFDIRVDVYGLGTILWELLVDIPHWEHELKHPGEWAKWLKARCEAPHRSAAERFANNREALEQAARNRGTNPKQLRLWLEQDLDWILAKALAINPEQRYAGVTQLRDDLVLFTKNKPILARAAHTRYKLYKLFKRHAFSLITTTVVATVLLISTVSAVYQGRQAIHANKKLRLQNEKLTRQQAFLTNLITAPHPNVAGPELKVVDLLLEREPTLKTVFERDPEMEAHARYTFAKLFFGIDAYQQALDQLDQALTLKMNLQKHPDLEALAMMILKAKTLKRLRSFEASNELYRHIIHLLAPQNNPESSPMLEAERLHFEALGDYAHLFYLRHKFIEAEKYYRAAMQGQMRLLGESHADTPQNIAGLGMTLIKLHRLDEGENLLRRALEIQDKILDHGHPQRLSTLSNLAYALLQTPTKASQAARYYREAWLLNQAHRGKNHPVTRRSLNGLVRAHMAEGDYAEAAHLGSLLYQEVCRPDQLHTSECLNAVTNLSGAYAKLGAPDVGLDLIRQNQAGFLPSNLDPLPAHARLLNNLGDYLIKMNDDRAAVPVLQKAVQQKIEIHGEKTIPTWNSKCNLGLALVKSGQVAAGLCLLDQVVAQSTAQLGSRQWLTLLYQTYLAEALAVSGSPWEAKALLTAVDKAAVSNPDLKTRLDLVATILTR
ncbi:serine/threonine-protein kinase [Acanthopleuribacter pedis]|uniref:Serine/threonine protein kinase n=1 Tax=Acanthopleuribacter pedis TaxID=442870 RepID=A0A8J7QIE5_9BACT|nr:serine/threonine-protein kinase [Acanthopleuribacter pedis]MBO1320900.1 serine/threonine protein kinase [Acanthopleuribacter pedis]